MEGMSIEQSINPHVRSNMFLLLQDVCWPQLPPLGDVILAAELPYTAVEPVALIALFPMFLPIHQRLPPS